MRILHTSDWHLGRIFHGLRLTADQEAVLAQITLLIKDKKVDVVVMAGDIYDRAVPPTEAVDLLDRTLSRWVNELQVPVIMIAGNHDNPNRVGFGTRLFAAANLHIFGPVTTEAKPVVLNDVFGPVYFVPLTYCEPLQASALAGEKLASHEAALQWQIKNMLVQIPDGVRKVALAHVFLTGAQESPDSERPLSIGGTTTVGIENFASFNYTALGHLHACQKNSATVRYCGSLMKYSFNETTQKKAVHIIDLAADGSIEAETVELTAPHELACLKGTFAELTERPRLDMVDNYLQITLTDATPILDAKNRLEKLYPHILQLGYEALELDDQKENLSAAGRKQLTAEELFAAFFQTTQGRKLNEAEAALLKTTLNTSALAERRF